LYGTIAPYTAPWDEKVPSTSEFESTSEIRFLTRRGEEEEREEGEKEEEDREEEGEEREEEGEEREEEEEEEW
jgi:hypothetical protein